MGKGSSGLGVKGGGGGGEKLGTSALINAPLGTKVEGGNGKTYVKGQAELPWKEQGSDNRYSSSALANARDIGGVTLTVDTVKAYKTIDKAGFKSTGGGQWELDLKGIGGASILDESGGTRAIRLGMSPNQKLYSMTWWDSDYKISKTQYFESLNDAKYYAKNNIKASLK